MPDLIERLVQYKQNQQKKNDNFIQKLTAAKQNLNTSKQWNLDPNDLIGRIMIAKSQQGQTIPTKAPTTPTANNNMLSLKENTLSNPSQVGGFGQVQSYLNYLNNAGQTQPTASKVDNRVLALKEQFLSNPKNVGGIGATPQYTVPKPWYQDPNRAVTLFDFTSGQPKVVGTAYVNPQDNKAYVNVNGKMVWVRDAYPNAQWTWDMNNKYVGYNKFSPLTDFSKIPTEEELRKEAEAIYNPLYEQRKQELQKAIEQAKSNISNQLLSRGMARSGYAVDKLGEIDQAWTKQLNEIDQERAAQIAQYISQQRENAINRALEVQKYNQQLPLQAQTYSQNQQAFPLSLESQQLANEASKQNLQQSKELFPYQKQTAQAQASQAQTAADIAKATKQTAIDTAKINYNILNQDYVTKVLQNSQLKQTIPLEVQSIMLDIAKKKWDNEYTKKMGDLDLQKAAQELAQIKTYNKYLPKQLQAELDKANEAILSERFSRYVQQQNLNMNATQLNMEMQRLKADLENTALNNKLKKLDIQKTQQELNTAKKQGAIDNVVSAAFTDMLQKINDPKSGITTPWDWLKKEGAYLNDNQLSSLLNYLKTLNTIDPAYLLLKQTGKNEKGK